MTDQTKRPRVLTGLRANNDLTIGNYLGALLPIVDMAKQRADEYDINLFVPDLHSFTTPIDHAQLQGQIMQNLKVFIAAGLPIDHNGVYIYRQSYLSAHSELTWILDCFTGFGEMNRMTQFKDKSAKGLPEGDVLHAEYDAVVNPTRVSVGLFNYPVLMAADILLYNTSYVPVGDDQTQHLEFTRDIAQRMNTRFGDLFTVPLPVPKQHEFFGKDQGLRIRDLVDPTKKMSKSDETGKGVIFMSDSPEAATKKIMGAATDSEAYVRFDWKNQPGVTNLLQILALLTHRDTQEVAAEWEGKTSYGELKKAVAEVVAGFLRDFHARLAETDDQVILKKLESSEAAMRDIANATLLRAQQAVGLRPHND
ncbi:MAG TPA: tryptophan--tRNA ligase [Candidatus Saccharimonadales bacterium]|nr:tryptophan--tRNA ligase [Candidatus Saccharimonadales bacterium]